MIQLKTARRIAAKWHNGQSSALYALSSTGHISEPAMREIIDMLKVIKKEGRKLQKGDRQELYNLSDFIHFHVYGISLTERLQEYHTEQDQNAK